MARMAFEKEPEPLQTEGGARPRVRCVGVRARQPPKVALESGRGALLLEGGRQQQQQG